MTEDMSETATLDELLAVLRRSHDGLVAVLTPLDGEQVSGPSYDDEWTIAQVASHLGSGAEIFELLLEAGLTSSAAPGLDRMQPIWDSWNAKRPAEQAEDALRADARFLDRLGSLGQDDRTAWHLAFFGSDRDLAGLLGMRVAEHAIHTWDIAVALDPTATVAADAVAVIVDGLSSVVARTGRGSDEPIVVAVTTTAPHRELVLRLSPESAELVPTGSTAAGTTATATLPAEALVRLVYGRLDPDHSPSTVHTEGVDLDALRRSFPGV